MAEGQHPTDRAVLEDFVVENDDLERLEDLLAEFNIFEALGVVRQELRHSDFLAFLLDPEAPHSMGDAFLRRFLVSALSEADDPPLSPVDIDVMDLSAAEVRREWRHIDVLVTDPAQRLTAVIENKVDAMEHGDQLERYRAVVRAAFPDHRTVFVYLTTDGRPPSCDAYIPVSYEAVVSLVDRFTSIPGRLPDDVRTALTHYATMIRRHIVSDSETADLCRKLWSRHRRALELLYEHRPDLAGELAAHLKDLRASVVTNNAMVAGFTSKTYTAFRPQDWDRLGERLATQGWELQAAPLFFEFDNHDQSLALRLYIAPGPRPIQQALHACAQANPAVFRGAKTRLSKNHTIIYERMILSGPDYDGAEAEDLVGKVDEHWHAFLTKDLDPILDAVAEIQWPVAGPAASE